MPKNLLPLSSILALFALSAALLVAAQANWIPPTTQPPGDNVPAPLNVGPQAQSKTGDLTIRGLLTLNRAVDRMLSFVRQGATFPTSFRLGTDSAFVINSGNRDLITFKGGSVGIGTTTPSPSAGLDVNFTNKGLLIPRIMTTAQRDAIASPANSLLIFNTTNGCLEIYNNGSWENVHCFSCIAPPAIPTANSATRLTSTSFNANWTSVSGAVTYCLDVATNSAFTAFVPGYNNLNVGNVTTYNVSGLTCGRTYYYRLRAGNACGTSANSNTMVAALSCG